MPASSTLRRHGYYVGDRPNADACIAKAQQAFTDLMVEQRRLSADTAGNANRLNNFVQDALAALKGASAFLAQRGEAA